MAANAGEIDITLADGSATLRSSLRAAKEVNAMFGDYQAAFKRLAAYDFSAYVAIVASGLGKQPRDVEERVYGVGLPSLTKPLSDFVALLSNGGRPLVAASEGATSGEG